MFPSVYLLTTDMILRQGEKHREKEGVTHKAIVLLNVGMYFCEAQLCYGSERLTINKREIKMCSYL